MPPKPKEPVKQAPVALICGGDDFSVKERGPRIYSAWTAELGGMDHEIIDAAAANSGEALKSLSRLREALETLPFFGTGKVVWFKNCNFLGTDRTSTSSAVSEAVAALALELKDFQWNNVRLLITAGDIDRRKAFYKTLDKIGTVEFFEGLSMETRDWAVQAESRVQNAFEARGKTITDGALMELVNRIGPNARQLDSEAEKLCLYIGERPSADVADVNAVASRNKNARAFALGDALGDRNLSLLLRRLDEELWEVKLDKNKSEIGLLYGLIHKMRSLLIAQELMREGWVTASSSTKAIKDQLDAIPDGKVPSDKRYNPKAINPYVLMKAMQQARNYSQAELVRAMDLLLQCNRLLVSSSLDVSLVLQQTLVKIARR